MRNRDNCDLRFEPDVQRSDVNHRQQQKVGAGRDMAEAGYQTLDQAETGPFTSKERRGLARDANYPRRY